MDFIRQLGGLGDSGPTEQNFEFQTADGRRLVPPMGAVRSTARSRCLTRSSATTTLAPVHDHHGDTEADDPLRESALRSRRAHDDRRARLSGPGGVLEDIVDAYVGGDARLVRPRLHVLAVRRRDSRRRSTTPPSGTHDRARRGWRAPAPRLRQAAQRGACEEARRDGCHRSPLPRQLPLCVGGRGELRLRRRGAVQRAGRRRLLPRVRRHPLWRLRALALRAQGTDGCPRARDHEARRARVEGRPQAANRGRELASSRSSSSASRPSAASRRSWRATSSPTRSRLQKLRLVVETAQEVWG